MKIIALADIHGGLGYLSAVGEELRAADLILIAGDITNFGGVVQMKHIFAELSRYNPNILAVGGNCDSPAGATYFADEGFSINCKCVEFDGVSFVGLAGSIADDQEQLGNSLEEHFVNSLDAIEKQTCDAEFLVLVTHQPASRSAVSGGGGSDAIYDFIERRQPILAVSGHMHEAAGKDTIGQCTLVNPGPFQHGSYASIEINGGKVKNVRIHQA
jgi:Icc-related predicted phosphoesterase